MARPALEEVRALNDEYWRSLRGQTTFRGVRDWIEITTPYLDRHNDYLQVYARPRQDGWSLTDDDHIIDDLVQAGCNIEGPKEQSLFHSILARFGVRLEAGALVVEASRGDFALRKHNLVQAMLSVGDLLHLSAPSAAGLFDEDLAVTPKAGDDRSLTSRAMQYTVVIEQSRNNFSAYVPDLPGCVATGASDEDALREIRQAIEFHIEGLRQQGEPVPEPCRYT